MTPVKGSLSQRLGRSQRELAGALREARQFVVIQGPAAAFPDVIAKIDAVLAEHGAPPPRAAATTPTEVKAARQRLGLSQQELAEVLRLGPNGERTIRRWEQGDVPITGPASLALEMLVEKGV